MKLIATLTLLILFISSSFVLLDKNKPGDLDIHLKSILDQHHFDGRIQDELEKRLGRKLDATKVNLGRLIFFDKGLGLHQDNSCAGCHSPGAGFGDSQPIAIGVNNNDIVGSHRAGPRNQRRTPTVINTAFYPNLMWNGRFAAIGDDPFNTSKGLIFPAPEDNIFANGSGYLKPIRHLLTAQGHIPFTEQPEMAGFTSAPGTGFASFSRFSGLVKENAAKNTRKKAMLFSSSRNDVNGKTAAACASIDFSIFNDGKGLTVPDVDPLTNSANFGIRDKVLTLVNGNKEYRKLFGKIYSEVKQGGPVTFLMIGEVVAEFEFSLTFAKAPIDEFARGNKNALTEAQKRGAVIFFTTGKCVNCHAVDGVSNQMFSDFKMHNAGVPAVHPVFGNGSGNVPFSDLNCAKSTSGTLDFGREEFSGDIADRYLFRSSPLRNLKLQPFFFHNGSFNSLKDAVYYHLDPSKNIGKYSPANNGVPGDLKYSNTDMDDIMKTLDPILKQGVHLSPNETNDLLEFLTEGLFDKKLAHDNLRKVVPAQVPSGVSLQLFEFENTPGNIASRNSNNTVATPLTVKQISIYPNPGRNSLYIQIPDACGITKMESLDAAGKLQLQQQANSTSTKLNLQIEALKPGAYFIRFTDLKNCSIVKKFIKQ